MPQGADTKRQNSTSAMGLTLLYSSLLAGTPTISSELCLPHCDAVLGVLVSKLSMLHMVDVHIPCSRVPHMGHAVSEGHL